MSQDWDGKPRKLWGRFGVEALEHLVIFCGPRDDEGMAMCGIINGGRDWTVTEPPSNQCAECLREQRLDVKVLEGMLTAPPPCEGLKNGCKCQSCEDSRKRVVENDGRYTEQCG